MLTKTVCLCQTGFAKRSCESQLPRTSVRPPGRLRPTEGEFVRSSHQSVRSGRTLYHTGARGLAQQQTCLRRLSPPSRYDLETTTARLHTPPTSNCVLNQRTVCVCAVNVRVRLLWTCLLGSCPPCRTLCLGHATWRHCFRQGWSAANPRSDLSVRVRLLIT